MEKLWPLHAITRPPTLHLLSSGTNNGQMASLSSYLYPICTMNNAQRKVQAGTSLQSKLNFKISSTENTELTVFWLRSLLLCHDTHSDNLTDKPCTKTTETALDRQQLFLCCDHLDPFWPCYYFIAVFTDFKTVISHIVSYYSRHNIDKNNVLKFRFVHYIELTMLRECDAMYNTSLSVQEWELYLYLVMWPDRWLWRWQWWRIVDY